MIWFKALKLTYKENESSFQVIIGFIISVLMVLIPSAEFFLGPPADVNGRWLIIGLGNLVMNFIVFAISGIIIYVITLCYVNVKKIVSDFKKSLKELTPVIKKETYKELKNDS